jgi:hypothetical protein
LKTKHGETAVRNEKRSNDFLQSFRGERKIHCKSGKFAKEDKKNFRYPVFTSVSILNEQLGQKRLSNKSVVSER